MLLEILSQTVRADGLALFRLFFGAILAFDSLRQRHFLCQFFTKSSRYFPHFALNFLQAPPHFYFQLLLFVQVFLAIFFSLGLYFPIVSKLLFMTQLYIFLLDKTLYSDAAYLRLLFLGLFCFVDAAAVFSLDQFLRESKALPYWKLFLFQSQVFIVYFFRALWKLSPAWRQGRGLFIPFLHFYVWRNTKHYTDFSKFFSEKRAYFLEKYLQKKELQKALSQALPFIECLMVLGLFFSQTLFLAAAIFLLYHLVYHLFSEKEFPYENYAMIFLWGLQ